MILTATISDPAHDAGADDISDGIEQRHLALFDTWANDLLDRLDDPVVRHTITTYLRWGQQRRLARAAVTNVLAPWSTHAARQQTLRAVDFLTWITSRPLALGDVDQHTIDRWFAEGTTTRIHTRHFLVWTQQQRLVARHLRFPIIIPGSGSPLPAADRDALVARLVNDTTIPDDVRIAGLLVALYAQPVTRVSRLQRRHITITDHGLLLALGSHPIEPVEPLPRLLATFGDAHSAGDAWLFPGQEPTRPVSPKTLGQRLLRHGVNRAARVAALHHLIEHVPTPVLANLIGYNPNFVADRAATLNTAWASYPTLRDRTSSIEQDSRS
jgi:hypothetical protein